jgi:hypothetical protein
MKQKSQMMISCLLAVVFLFFSGNDQLGNTEITSFSLVHFIVIVPCLCLLRCKPSLGLAEGYASPHCQDRKTENLSLLKSPL